MLGRRGRTEKNDASRCCVPGETRSEISEQIVPMPGFFFFLVGISLFWLSVCAAMLHRNLPSIYLATVSQMLTSNGAYITSFCACALMQGTSNRAAIYLNDRIGRLRGSFDARVNRVCWIKGEKQGPIIAV